MVIQYELYWDAASKGIRMLLQHIGTAGCMHEKFCTCFKEQACAFCEHPDTWQPDSSGGLGLIYLKPWLRQVLDNTGC